MMGATAGMPPPPPAASSVKRVAIIGGGFAGLAAARTLLSQQHANLAVSLFEAGPQVGGRARTGQLAAGPVELGATWFHGTVGNPVYELSQRLQQQQLAPSAAAEAAVAAPAAAGGHQQTAPAARDTTANAAGNARWELQLVAPGLSEPLAPGQPQHRAVLEAFAAYSQAVEDVAEDAAGTAATAAQAAAAAAAAHPGGAVQQQPGSTLGQILRARYEQIMAPPPSGGSGSGSVGVTPSSDDASGAKQPEEEQEHMTTPELAAWLRADADGVLRQRFAEGWGCRERLQRAYDGFHSADVAGLAHMTEYKDLDGPNIPVPGGYQSLATTLAAEACALGLQLHLGAPVQRISWARPDGCVALTVGTPQAAGAASGGAGDEDSSQQQQQQQQQQQMVFDAVIVTTSLGVLKTQAGRLFDPPLPASKAAAVSALHIGQVEKLFVEWPPAPPGVADGAAAAAAAQRTPLGSAAVVGPRKPKPQQQQQPDAAAASATAAGAAPEVEDSFTTYCLLWPTPGEVWGLHWQQQQQEQEQAVVGMDIPALSDSVYAAGPSSLGHQQQQQQQPASLLPTWLRGLHSWRYGDGPEWIKPRTPSQPPQQPASRSAVVWVTGRAALEMGRLSDEEVLRDLEVLLATFPAIPRPPGSSSGSGSVNSLAGCRLMRSTWTSSELTRGSYSYPGPAASVDTADVLAAPLTRAHAGGLDAAVGQQEPEPPLVCFAGEATSRHSMGTVHGAFQTGVREAQRLLAAWGVVAGGRDKGRAAADAQAGGPDAGGDGEAGEAEAGGGAGEYHAAFWL